MDYQYVVHVYYLTAPHHIYLMINYRAAVDKRFLRSKTPLFTLLKKCSYMKFQGCIQSCMSFTEKIVVAKFSAKAMHSDKVMQFIH